MRSRLGIILLGAALLSVQGIACAQQASPVKPILLLVVAQRINRATAAVVDNAKFKQDIAKLEWRNLNGARTPEGTAEYLRQERARWGVIVKEIGLQPQ